VRRQRARHNEVSVPPWFNPLAELNRPHNLARRNGLRLQKPRLLARLAKVHNDRPANVRQLPEPKGKHGRPKNRPPGSSEKPTVANAAAMPASRGAVTTRAVNGKRSKNYKSV